MTTSVEGKKHNKLTNRYEQQVQVAFPLQPMGGGGSGGEGKQEGEAEWLSEEDFQTYSVRVRVIDPGAGMIDRLIEQAGDDLVDCCVGE